MWINLAEIKGRRALEFPVIILDAIKTIAKDPEAADGFKNLVPGESHEELLSRIVKSRITIMERYPDEIAVILAANQNVPVDDWTDSIDMESYVTDIVTMMADPLMRNFFASQQIVLGSSESARESIEGS